MHSVELFDHLLDPFLPASPLYELGDVSCSTDVTAMEKVEEERHARREAELRLVRVDQIAGFGYLRSFQRGSLPSRRQQGGSNGESTVSLAADDTRNSSGLVVDDVSAEDAEEWGDVQHLEVTHGGHDRVQYSEVTLRCLRDIMSR
jgi:hypothetical protein